MEQSSKDKEVLHEAIAKIVTDVLSTLNVNCSNGGTQIIGNYPTIANSHRYIFLRTAGRL